MLAAAARWQADEREGERGTSGFAFLLNRLQPDLIEKALNVVDAGFVVLRLCGGLALAGERLISRHGAEGFGVSRAGCLPG